MGDLDKLGLKHSTDKGIVHHYLAIYEQYLEGRRDQIRDVLEIGVDLGRSLRMWRDYFPNAQIVGMDLNPACASQAGERIKIRIGDSTKIDVIERELGGAAFDLIVDDGSHVPEDQLMTLCWLWPRLGGFYFVEDVDPAGAVLLGCSGLLRPKVFRTGATPGSTLVVFEKPSQST